MELPNVDEAAPTGHEVSAQIVSDLLVDVQKPAVREGDPVRDVSSPREGLNNPHLGRNASRIRLGRGRGGAALALITVGRVSDPWDINVTSGFFHIEADAVIAAFNSDEQALSVLTCRQAEEGNYEQGCAVSRAMRVSPESSCRASMCRNQRFERVTRCVTFLHLEPSAGRVPTEPSEVFSRKRRSWKPDRTDSRKTSSSCRRLDRDTFRATVRRSDSDKSQSKNRIRFSIDTSRDTLASSWTPLGAHRNDATLHALLPGGDRLLSLGASSCGPGSPWLSDASD